jgi:hypothetical protein
MKSQMDVDESDYGGRYSGGKRKRGAFEDYESDDDSPSSKDPNAYDSKLANQRHRLIQAEFQKRRSGGSAEFTSAKNVMNEEERELLRTTSLIDPENSKVPTLTLKSRTCWHAKIAQALHTNANQYGSANESELDDLALQFEHEAFVKAKNTMIYTAGCMKRITAIMNATKSKVSYVAEFKAQRERDETDRKTAESVQRDGPDDEEASKTSSCKENTNAGFTSALSMMNVKKTEPVGSESDAFGFDFLKVKEEALEKKPKVEFVDKEPIVSNKLYKMPSIVKKEPLTKPQEILVVDDDDVEPPMIHKPAKETKQEPDIYEIPVPKQNHVEKAEVVKTKLVSNAIFSTEKPTAAPRLDLVKISSLVVAELTILYKAGKFANKEVFKSIARSFSHFILDKKRPRDESTAVQYLKSMIAKLNGIATTIQNESDFQFILV